MVAPSIQTSDANSALIGVFAADLRTSFNMVNPTPLTEIADVQHAAVASGPTMAIGRGVQATAGATGDRNASIGTSNIRWASQMIALHAVPGPADTYNQTDVDQWIPVKFTGLDNDSPAVTNHEAYVDANNNPRPSTDIVHAIGCFDVSQVGTNLATPLEQARQYLAAHGRDPATTPGLKQGIILETDGQPEHNNGQTGVGNWQVWATCADSTAKANAVKNDGIELFMIGYGVEGRSCPDVSRSATVQLASMATNSPIGQRLQLRQHGAAERREQRSATTSSAPRRAATSRTSSTRRPPSWPAAPASSRCTRSRSSAACRPAPRPPATRSRSRASTSTEAYAVTFGGVNAGGFTVVSDTVITAVVPPGGAGTTVDVQVSTPGGTSIISSGDKFKYP